MNLNLEYFEDYKILISKYDNLDPIKIQKMVEEKYGITP